ncbi:MAG: hypothetical protein ACLQMH_07850 [Solirubrobacteraceae bacterium]
MGPASKLLTAAEPAVQGARAALLAAKGVEGALEIVEDVPSQIVVMLGSYQTVGVRPQGR